MEMEFKGLDRGFNALVLSIANALWPKGWDVNDYCPDTLEDLMVEYHARGRITVMESASDQTIYGDAEVNYAARAWHDWVHIMYELPFNVKGEREACAIQQRHIFQRLGQGDNATLYARWLWAEVIGQTEHFTKWNVFPFDQIAFVKAYATLGPQVALTQTW